MTFVAALVVAGALAALALVHFFWVLGGGRGFGAAIPEANGKPLFTPHPIATALVGCALLVAAAIVLGRVGAWGAAWPPWIFRFGTWGLTGAFFLRAVGDFRYAGLFRRVRGTPFARWDARLFTPLCLTLSALLLLVARAPGLGGPA